MSMKGHDEQSAGPLWSRLLPGEGHTPQPSWALLDLLGYIEDRENSTSACGKLGNGLPIRVTFCTAPPPLVSYLCVWCPDQKPDEKPHIRSCDVEATDSDLVFLYVTQRSRCGPSDCFVYKACNGGQGPSLRRLELPDQFRSSFTHNEIALVPHRDVVARPVRGARRIRLRPNQDEIAFFRPHASEGSGEGFILRPWSHAGDNQSSEERFILRPCSHGEGDNDFYVALLRYKQGVSGAGQHEYELCVFHSTDGQWRHMPFSISHGRLHLTYKAINLGQGGLVGFVDPWRGIIVCDVLGHRPVRYLPLPAELIVDTFHHDNGLLHRDIALIEGRLTLVNLCDIGKLDTNLNCQSWEVSTWSRKVTELWEEDWRQDYVVGSGDFSIDGDATDNVDLLHKVMGDDGSMSPTLEMPYTAHPILSLSESHVVHVMGKVKRNDRKVLVMAVDLKQRKLQAVTLFHAERMLGIPFDYIYMHCRIPKYFNPDPRENLKRPGMFRATYPRKLHETSVQISGGEHEAGSSKGVEPDDNTMDVDVLY